MTTAGDLRESITIQLQEQVDDGAGNTVGEWVDVVTVPARIRPLKGGETVMAGRLAGTETYIVTVRYSTATAAITTAYRAVNARTAEVYNIRSVANTDERRAYLDLLCETGVAT